jgi:uncharacterized protein (UPF0335 family)
MYVEECLVRERHQQRLRQAQEARAAHQVVELRKLEKRQRRAEQALLHARKRVDQLRSTIGAVS